MNHPLWEYNIIIANTIDTLSIRDRRVIFNAIKTLHIESPDVFFPQFGFTLGEFSVWYMISARKNRR